MAIYHNGIKVSSLFHNGERINKIFHNGKCIYIYVSITAGESLYDGIPSNGIMLYGTDTGGPSSNPLGIQGDSINLKAPLSSCPNGIKIHFSRRSYYGSGLLMYPACRISDISIPKGSSSGSSHIFSRMCTDDRNSNITASIKGSTLSFIVDQYNDIDHQTNTGTVTYTESNQPIEMLAITSITAY